MVVALVPIGVLGYRSLTGSPTASAERGIAALRQGDWGKAAGFLGALDPQNDRDQVHQVARLLDQTTVLVPGGILQMGYAEGAPDQQPVHEVQVSQVHMDRFEVTNIQYQRFVDETGRAAPGYWAAGHYPRGEGMRPVVGVTWEDAIAYAAWAGKRLPTEAEWEWAARGAEGRLYPWGNDDRATTRAHTADQGDTMGPTDVGSYPQGATLLGIMDLAGNVREWTADRYGPYRVPHAPPAEGAGMAVRGGSWRRYNDYATARERVARDSYADDLGFRCVRDADR